jgi:hypothetical protein
MKKGQRAHRVRYTDWGRKMRQEIRYCISISTVENLQKIVSYVPIYDCVNFNDPCLVHVIKLLYLPEKIKEYESFLWLVVGDDPFPYT